VLFARGREKDEAEQRGREQRSERTPIDHAPPGSGWL
jgi:hypothetical protein